MADEGGCPRLFHRARGASVAHSGGHDAPRALTTEAHTQMLAGRVALGPFNTQALLRHTAFQVWAQRRAVTSLGYTPRVLAALSGSAAVTVSP